MFIQDRFHFRAVITAEYFTNDRKNATTAFINVIIDDVDLYSNGEIGFSADALNRAVARLSLSKMERASVCDWFEIMYPKVSEKSFRGDCKEIMQSIGMRDCEKNLIFERDFLEPWGAYSAVVVRGSQGINGWQLFATTSKSEPLKPIREFPNAEQIAKFRVIGNEYIKQK